MSDLKFIAYYRRKVQPKDYEAITFGLEEEFPKPESGVEEARDEAFKQIIDHVEMEIDLKLQKLLEEERERRR